MSGLTQEYLKSVLGYNPHTGVFIWLVNNTRININDIAGSKDANGYRLIKINGKKFKEHRLAFLYITGQIPIEVDHINHIRDDNRWVNLRSCSKNQNQWNSTLRSDNSSGYKGVVWNKNAKKWEANIRYNNKKIYLGLFNSKEKAGLAYNKASLRYHRKFACLNNISSL